MAAATGRPTSTLATLGRSTKSSLQHSLWDSLPLEPRRNGTQESLYSLPLEPRQTNLRKVFYMIKDGSSKARASFRDRRLRWNKHLGLCGDQCCPFPRCHRAAQHSATQQLVWVWRSRPGKSFGDMYRGVLATHRGSSSTTRSECSHLRHTAMDKEVLRLQGPSAEKE